MLVSAVSQPRLDLQFFLCGREIKIENEKANIVRNEMTKRQGVCARSCVADYDLQCVESC